MSIAGKANKLSGDMRRAIQTIANGASSDFTGNPRGTRKIEGYVCAINTEGELAGTIDVQEFNYEPGEYGYEGAGHHQGVLLSAIQDNSKGIFVIPQLFSDVIIVQNPSDNKEYVLMYSHAQYIQLQSTENINIGVTEYKDFKESDDGLEDDFNELEETGMKTVTTYSAEAIETKATKDDEGFVQVIDRKKKTIEVGDTKIYIDGEKVTIETTSKVEFKVGDTTITEEDGKVTVDTKEASVKAGTVSVESQSTEVKGSDVTITGGNLKVKGSAGADLNGPFNPIKVCPFSGAPHCGSSVSGT